MREASEKRPKKRFKNKKIKWHIKAVFMPPHFLQLLAAMLPPLPVQGAPREPQGKGQRAPRAVKSGGRKKKNGTETKKIKWHKKRFLCHLIFCRFWPQRCPPALSRGAKITARKAQRAPRAMKRGGTGRLGSKESGVSRFFQ